MQQYYTLVKLAFPEINRTAMTILEDISRFHKALFIGMSPNTLNAFTAWARDNGYMVKLDPERQRPVQSFYGIEIRIQADLQYGEFRLVRQTEGWSE